MDIIALVYAFVSTLGAPQFVINEVYDISSTQVEVDVQTMGMKPSDQRYILLLDKGLVIQQVQVPLTEEQCQTPT